MSELSELPLPDKGRFNGDISQGIIYQGLTGEAAFPPPETPDNDTQIHTSTSTGTASIHDDTTLSAPQQIILTGVCYEIRPRWKKENLHIRANFWHE